MDETIFISTKKAYSHLFTDNEKGKSPKIYLRNAKSDLKKNEYYHFNDLKI